jgi:pimeloyl-ACP methyl ester carboxylesterase
MAGDLRGMARRRDSTDLLREIRVPTLVVVGDQDAITPPAESEMMASTIPGATLVKIPGAGHLSNLENPQAFTSAIRDFLRSHR